MKRVGLLCLVIGVCCLFVQNGRVSAASPQPWIDSPITKISESSLKPSIKGITTCSGATMLIDIAEITESRTACVYGGVSGVRIARFIDYENILRYVVAFPSEVKFYELRNVCVGVEYCVYSQSEDAAIIREETSDGRFGAKVINDFSKQLVKHKQATTIYFTVKADVGEGLRNQSSVLATRSVAISPNGTWSIVEIPGYGLIRVDMKTGAYRWIAALGTENGSYAEDPPNLTISNSGGLVAMTGWYHGVDIYAIDTICGYETLSRPPTVAWCPKSFVSQQQLAQDFITGYGLRFSDDNKKLSIVIIVDEGARKVFLSPTPYEESASPRYLAFGDSFTSGEGEVSDDFYLPDTNTASNRCHVSNRSYAYLLSSYWETFTTNYACSGSRIPDVRAKSAEVLMNSTKSASILSVGVGGNDVDLVGKMKSCLGPGVCEWASVKNRSATISEMNRLLPNLIALITDMQSNSPVPMFIVGYPLVINASDEAKCTPLINSLLSKEERIYIDESIRYLNRIIETAAQYTDIAYVDIESALLGERLCDDSEKSMNSIRYGDDIAPLSALPELKIVGSESFHPTPRGHERIAHAIESQLRGFWQSSSCLGCEAHKNATSYWTEGLNVATQLLMRFSQLFIQVEDIQSGQSVAFSFPTGTFTPKSKVELELHSDPQKVGTFISNADGSLLGVFTIPVGIQGYHTVHAFNTTLTEQTIDIYQTIYIKPAAYVGLGAEEKEVNNAPFNPVLLPVPTKTQSKPKTTLSNQSVLGNQTLVFQPTASSIPSLKTPSNKISHDFLAYCLFVGAILLIIVTVLFARKV